MIAKTERSQEHIDIYRNFCGHRSNQLDDALSRAYGPGFGSDGKDGRPISLRLNIEICKEAPAHEKPDDRYS